MTLLLGRLGWTFAFGRAIDMVAPVATHGITVSSSSYRWVKRQSAAFCRIAGAMINDSPPPPLPGGVGVPPTKAKQPCDHSPKRNNWPPSADHARRYRLCRYHHSAGRDGIMRHFLGGTSVILLLVGVQYVRTSEHTVNIIRPFQSNVLDFCWWEVGRW
jgi:hypothetical protein